MEIVINGIDRKANEACAPGQWKIVHSREQSWWMKTSQKFPSWSHSCLMFRCNSAHFAHFTALKLCRDRLLRYRVSLIYLHFIELLKGCILIPHLENWPAVVVYVSYSLSIESRSVLRFSGISSLSVFSDVKSEMNTVFRKLLYLTHN